MTGPKPNDECEHEIYAHCIECGTTFERHPTDCISIAWVEELEMKVDELKSMAEFHLNHCKVTSSNYISIAEVEKIIEDEIEEIEADKDTTETQLMLKFLYYMKRKLKQKIREAKKG